MDGDEAEVDIRMRQTAIATGTTVAAAHPHRLDHPEEEAAFLTGSRTAAPRSRETTIAISREADRTLLLAVTATSRLVEAVVIIAGQKTAEAEVEADAVAEEATRAATAVGNIAGANTEVAICRLALLLAFGQAPIPPEPGSPLPS